MRNRKGFVLLHVLVILIVMVSIAAGLAKMLLARQAALAKAAAGAAGRKVAEGGLGQVLAKWADPTGPGPCYTATRPTDYSCADCVAPAAPAPKKCTLSSTLLECTGKCTSLCTSPKTIAAEKKNADPFYTITITTCD